MTCDWCKDKNDDYHKIAFEKRRTKGNHPGLQKRQPISWTINKPDPNAIQCLPCTAGTPSRHICYVSQCQGTILAYTLGYTCHGQPTTLAYTHGYTSQGQRTMLADTQGCTSQGNISHGRRTTQAYIRDSICLRRRISQDYPIGNTSYEGQQFNTTH